MKLIFNEKERKSKSKSKSKSSPSQEEHLDVRHGRASLPRARAEGRELGDDGRGERGGDREPHPGAHDRFAVKVNLTVPDSSA